TSKTQKAKAFGTPILEESAFTHLLRDVAPAVPAPGAALPHQAPAPSSE
ncbi:DEDDh family exonuclease, partial [Streptomyces sp. SID7499]|nr:DEDDh family exonuclease [Streptomyces sp. SID7499]